MKLLIIIEYIINLFILLFYHMHMFQLNSYFYVKHMHWITENIKKIILQILGVLIPTLLVLSNNIKFNVLAIVFLGISIYYNLPKKKSKVKFIITNRIKRMFVTEILLILLVFLLSKNNIYLKLGFINILSPIICIIANLLNTPIEFVRKKHYINLAKKILLDMPDLIVIGVTGSYGKTSMKNFLKTTLEKKYEVLVTPKNYNTTMGVVKTIREKLKPIHQIFICEMGATKPNDIKEICDIVKPKFGIITSIGPQHLESFKNIENIAKTKFELIDSVKNNNGTVFLNFDNEYLATHVSENTFITYGINNSKLNYNAFNIKLSPTSSSFFMMDKLSNKEIEFKTKLIGAHNIVNIAGAIAVSNYLGIELNDLVFQIKKIENVEHRLNLITNNNLNIIDDSYNSNPISSKSALDTLSQFEGIKIIITPGLIELGKYAKLYNEYLGKYACKICDYIFLVKSKQSQYVLDGIFSTNFNKKNLFNAESPQAAMKQITNLNLIGKVNVLIENDLPDNYI